MGFLLLLCLGWGSQAWAAPTHSIQTDSIRSLGESSEWKALLQYQKNFLGAESSEVDGSRFFLSPEGSTDPVAELKSTLQAFAAPIVKDKKGEDNEHALCRFPARYAWLMRQQKNGRIHLDNEHWPHPRCASFHVYRDRIQKRQVSVVFSSYYSGSASSVFGHSFLKFSGTNDNELFDTGINFAANPTTHNPVLYALYGLIGVFPATFSAQPFYYKVREYNDFESRDLWTYDLNLSSAQKTMLIAHLWELGNTYYHYFYFNENCSYQILRAIEGAIPSIRFFKSRPIYLIPSESIKLLNGIPGLVTGVSYRPSLRTVAYHGYAGLNASQKQELLADLHDRNRISDDAHVVDVLMDAIDLNQASKIAANDPQAIDWKERVLRKRATLDRADLPERPPVPIEENPMLGHGSRRITLGYTMRGFSAGDAVGGASGGRPALDFKVRASHHDLLDPSIGYPRYLHIDFGRVGFRYLPQPKRFLLDDLTIVDLTALSVEHPLYSKWSYNVRLGYGRKWFLDCDDPAECGTVSVKAGVGKTYPLGGRNVVFGLLDFEPSYGSGYRDSRFKVGVNPTVQFLFEWEPAFKSLFKAGTTYTAWTEHAWMHEASLDNRYVFSNRFGIDLELSYAKQDAESLRTLALRGLYYF